jgi:hypothetical protein
MTLTEYFNQPDPERMPNVVLLSNEFKVFSGYRIAGILFSPVHVKYPNGNAYKYIHVQGDSALYVADEDGNPKRRSCFQLPENVTFP